MVNLYLYKNSDIRVFISRGCEGSCVAVVLFEEVRVFHRPHPSPNTDKGAVASVRKWLEQHGVEP
jgi:hypothetical protein